MDVKVIIEIVNCIWVYDLNAISMTLFALITTIRMTPY